MFKVLKAEQRPREKGDRYEVLSFLPYYNGYVKPFGDLIGIEEVLVSPGGGLVPVQEGVEMLFIGRAGSLEVFREDEEPGLLKKNTCLVSRSEDSEITLRNEREHGLSRMISLGFRVGEAEAPSRSMETLEMRFRGTRTTLQTIASGSSEEPVIRLSLDADVSLAQIGKEEKLVLETLPSRRILIAVLEGRTAVAKSGLVKNDSVMIMGEPLVNLYAYELTRILIVDLPEFISPCERDDSGDAKEEKREISVWRFDD